MLDNATDYAKDNATYSNAGNIVEFQYYAWGIAGSILAAFGLVGNILSIIVLANRRMKSATSCYLIALSLYDCIVLVSLVLNMSLIAIHIKTKQLLWYHDTYLYLQPYLYPLALTAQTCSIYTTVGFTVERYIAVCFPLKATIWCTISRARKAILVILVASVIYNIPRMMEYRTEYYTNQNNITYTGYVLTDFGSHPMYRHLYFIYLHMAIMLLIPFSVLAVLNVLLIRAVRRSQKAQGKVTNKQHKENNLTIMLIAVIVVFLICQVPSIADNILAVTLDQDIVNSPSLVKLTVISSICVITNSAVNFYLYCMFGHKFRRVFQHVLCRCTPLGQRADTDTILMRNSLGKTISPENRNSMSQQKKGSQGSGSPEKNSLTSPLLSNNNSRVDNDQNRSIVRTNGKANVLVKLDLPQK